LPLWHAVCPDDANEMGSRAAVGHHPCEDRGGDPRHTVVAGRMGSLLWRCPRMGEAGTTGEQRPEQRQIITQEHLTLVPARLQAEGVSAGPVDGELNAQTEAALRHYQQTPGLPVAGAVDEATLETRQLRLPATPGGEREGLGSPRGPRDRAGRPVSSRGGPPATEPGGLIGPPDVELAARARWEARPV
jgi:Putative peptidoglycan binding domain